MSRPGSYPSEEDFSPQSPITCARCRDYVEVIDTLPTEVSVVWVLRCHGRIQIEEASYRQLERLCPVWRLAFHPPWPALELRDRRPVDPRYAPPAWAEPLAPPNPRLRTYTLGIG